jgi:ABC-type multidrug transport system permease subunit
MLLFSEMAELNESKKKKQERKKMTDISGFHIVYISLLVISQITLFLVLIWFSLVSWVLGIESQLIFKPFFRKPIYHSVLMYSLSLSNNAAPSIWYGN